MRSVRRTSFHFPSPVLAGVLIPSVGYWPFFAGPDTVDFLSMSTFLRRILKEFVIIPISIANKKGCFLVYFLVLESLEALFLGIDRRRGPLSGTITGGTAHEIEGRTMAAQISLPDTAAKHQHFSFLPNWHKVRLCFSMTYSSARTQTIRPSNVPARSHKSSIQTRGEAFVFTLRHGTLQPVRVRVYQI